MKRYIISSLIVLCIPALLGAKMYKWEDENGVMQFSTTPPPSHISQAEQVKYGGSGGRIDARRLIGTSWWSVIDGQMAQLSIRSDAFQILRYKKRHLPKFHMVGKWEIRGKDIQFFYKDTQDRGKMRKLMVPEIGESSLVLLNESGGRTVYKRTIEKKPATPRERMLIGTWHSTDGSGNKWEFQEGNFTLLKGGSMRVELVTGNWRMSGDSMRFEYVTDFDSARQDKVGKLDHWAVVELKPRYLVLQNQQTRRLLELSRQRPLQ